MTIAKSQGATVDITHTLATPGLDTRTAYTALSRGRHANHLHTPSPHLDLEPHAPPPTPHPPTPSPAPSTPTTPNTSPSSCCRRSRAVLGRCEGSVAEPRPPINVRIGARARCRPCAVDLRIHHP